MLIEQLTVNYISSKKCNSTTVNNVDLGAILTLQITILWPRVKPLVVIAVQRVGRDKNPSVTVEVVRNAVSIIHVCTSFI